MELCPLVQSKFFAIHAIQVDNYYDITIVLIMIIMGINASSQVAYTDESIHLYMPNYSITAIRWGRYNY